MSDNLKDTGPEDSSRVSTGESWEVAYWTHRFGCTEEELREAVRAVGNMTADVRDYFNGTDRSERNAE